MKRPEKAPPTRLVEGLHAVSIHLLRRARIGDLTSGLSPARLSALSVIVYAGPLQLKVLADAEQVKPPTMTKLVQALETDGLVQKEKDPEDGRAYRLIATPKGKALLESARQRRLEVLREALSDLTEEELGTLDAATTILRRVF